MASKLEKFSDNQLIKYMKFVFQSVPGEYLGGDIDDFYNGLKNEGYKKKLGAPFGGQFSRFDVEYLYYLLKNNDSSNYESGSIDRPTLEDVDIRLNQYERQWVTYTYFGNIDTYLPDDLNGYYLEELRQEDEFDPYNWDVDTETTDSEVNDSEWDIG